MKEKSKKHWRKQETKSWFFGRIYSIDKSLPTLMRERETNYRIIHEGRDAATNPAEQLYANKFVNLDKIEMSRKT